jgi:hypothetical protein
MPKDDKKTMPTTPPRELPMPKYGYQRSNGGSVSSTYRTAEAQKVAPVHHLQNVVFS